MILGEGRGRWGEVGGWKLGLNGDYYVQLLELTY